MLLSNLLSRFLKTAPSLKPAVSSMMAGKTRKLATMPIASCQVYTHKYNYSIRISLLKRLKFREHARTSSGSKRKLPTAKTPLPTRSRLPACHRAQAAMSSAAVAAHSETRAARESRERGGGAAADHQRCAAVALRARANEKPTGSFVSLSACRVTSS